MHDCLTRSDLQGRGHDITVFTTFVITSENLENMDRATKIIFIADFSYNTPIASAVPSEFSRLDIHCFSLSRQNLEDVPLDLWNG
jgi:hypothetical protein